MFGRFMPTEGKFFDLFNQHAECMIAGSRELAAMLNDLPNAESRTVAVQNSEKKADRITHETIDLMHKTFITPFDRDEIHKLISTMDDILDLMEDVATAVWMYGIKSVPTEARQLGEICVKCCERVQSAVALLNNMDRARDILKLCEEIDGLESEADRLLRGSPSKLFREEADVKELIKQKAVSELLESVTDKCEDVANIIEGIVLENA